MRALALLFSTLLLLTFLPSAAAASTTELATELGEIREPREMQAGGLLLRSVDGLREAPAVATDVVIEVSGLISRTQVTQRFTNPTLDWVEGVYVFPLPEGSAVDSLRMRIGDRILEGHVEERAKAKATYTQAKREGRKATLVEQERPNIFTTSIANLGPDEEVEVILTYQEDIRYDAGRFTLRFPMVVGPRFIPGTPSDSVEGFSGTGWASPTHSVPDAARITPPVAHPTRRRTHPVTIRAEIQAGFALEEVVSPSHPIRVTAARGNTYNIRLAKDAAQANADFILEWQPTVGNAPAAALFRESWEGEDYALLMVLPPKVDPYPTRRISRETIIVIDTSGSMGGASIAEAKNAVAFALKTLRPEDAFNVIEFNSTFTRLFQEAEPASSDNIKVARQWVRNLEANGGTNMQPALEAALRLGSESRAVRQIIFVTDGAVGNESELFGVIEKKLDQSRLYTVGIGSAPNSHFMSKAAEFGRGTFTYIGRPEEVAEKMGDLFRKIDSPVLHDLAIDWGDANVEAWPARIPDVYLGEPVVVAARLPQGVTQVTLRGRRGAEEIRLDVSLGGGSDHEGVSRLWARRKVAALMNKLHEGEPVDRISAEVAALGVRHQLVTRWSSLVAVDVTPTAPPNVETDTRAIPSLLPAGWDFRKIFGGSDPEQIAQDRRDAAAQHQSVSRATTHATTNAVGIVQPLAMIQIGSLPQGGTPATLLMMLGSSLIGGAGAALGLRHRRAGRKK